MDWQGLPFAGGRTGEAFVPEQGAGFPSVWLLDVFSKLPHLTPPAEDLTAGRNREGSDIPATSAVGSGLRPRRVLVQHPLQRAPVNAEVPGGGGDIAVMLLEHPLDVLPLEPGQG